jgi:hypothetical protein
MLSDGKDKLSSLEISIETSLAGSRIDSPAQHLFAILGRLPDGLLLDDTVALLGKEGRKAAAQLLAARLAEEQSGRLRMLAPIREYAAEKVFMDKEAGSLMEHFFALATELPLMWKNSPDPARASAAQREIINIEAVAKSEIELFCSSGVPSKTGLGGGDLVWCAIGLGDAWWRRANLELAAASYQRAITILKLMEQNRPGDSLLCFDLVIALNRLGLVRERPNRLR